MYEGLAAVYDRLSTINHSDWIEFIEHLFNRNQLAGRRILDLACGTGNICLELARRGYNPVGVDLAEEMLAVAESKLRDFGVPLFKADMRRLPDLGSFDAVLCLGDSFNYLVHAGELEQVLLHLRQLNPQMLIFDLNTPYYLSQVLGDNTFQHVEEDLVYVWDNTYDHASNLCEMQLSFFSQVKHNFYVRFDELHCEKAYELEEIRRILAGSGWNLLHVYDGFTPAEPADKTWRWLFLVVPGQNT